MTISAYGECLCGAAGYQVNGEVQFAMRCHCRDCQHISGAGHLPQIAVKVADFIMRGTVKSFSKSSDLGNDVTLTFCDGCGSPLFKETSKMPEVKFLCAGSLDSDLVKDPFQRVFEDGRRCWDN